MAEVLWWLALGLGVGFGVVWLIRWAWFQDHAEQRNEQELVGELEEWLRGKNRRG